MIRSAYAVTGILALALAGDGEIEIARAEPELSQEEIDRRIRAAYPPVTEAECRRIADAECKRSRRAAKAQRIAERRA